MCPAPLLDFGRWRGWKREADRHHKTRKDAHKDCWTITKPQYSGKQCMRYCLHGGEAGLVGVCVTACMSGFECVCMWANVEERDAYSVCINKIIIYAYTFLIYRNGSL